LTLVKPMSPPRLISKTSISRSIRKICSECCGVLSDSELCPTCGCEFALFEAGTNPSRRWLLSEEATNEEKRRFYAEQVQIAQANGYKISWASWQYRERFNEDPPRELRVA
jgi:hypothetical protein